MEGFANLVAAVNSFAWGPVMLLLIVGTGLFLTIRLKGIQFTQLGYALKLALSPKKSAKAGDSEHADGDVSHFQALMIALAATIGTGNIVGVAGAIIIGGPGAAFWMWITALVGMATKYSEAVLAVHFRQNDDKGMKVGGPMYYIEKGLGWKWLAVLFALFGTIASFGIGNMSQSNSVAVYVEANMGLPTWITGIVLTILVGLVVLGGIKWIANVSSLVVPLMAAIYIVGGLIALILNAELIPGAIATIVGAAFSMEAGIGWLVGTVIRYGVARGVFSNEAGLGSAPIAAAAAKTDHACRQGLVSMTGTFLDTICVCTITALTIVMSGLYNVEGANKNALTGDAFNMLLPGEWGGMFITIALIFFAFSTILGWSYYGEKCLYYLGGAKGRFIYRVIFTVFVYIGCTMELSLAWDISDTFNGLMAIPNPIGLLALSGVVVAQTKDFMKIRKQEQLEESKNAK